MGPKNLLILFFSTVAVSLVILIIFFSLFFKNVNLDFNTRLPESAPDVGSRFSETSTMSPDSKADGLMRSTVNVPPDFKEPEPNTQRAEKSLEEAFPSDADLPPVSDDALLENDYPKPLPDSKPDLKPEKAALNEKTNTRGTPSLPPARSNRPAAETSRSAEPLAAPCPIEDSVFSESDSSSAPPVPQ
ncbi:hypothetical protein [Vampirovibrio sp.]|uniref:hypothetical protein n=1 Tax=Vampirovibrio sp. TaxID=2717857 RepID=UPI0035931B26